ncbi:hypothetical protein [Desulfosporosinus sp.]|uniref:hypothetical protein n=1 Tax=Desulfosporosinus sp. TaxID=157907 RepID=UPI0025C462FA|nr:hypothetical protein [Desulfosporosinus sp.]MBC2721840.1 hypothetical protein [Desulfosporosinus sp.]MBC2726256.1 hypothetical protein [Desulfosporosinus sp.]
MHSHYGIDRSSKVRLKDLVKLLNAAQKKESEDSLWEMWLTLYPKMNKDNFESFEDYKNRAIKSVVRATEKTSEEIISELMPVIAAHEGKK